MEYEVRAAAEQYRAAQRGSRPPAQEERDAAKREPEAKNQLAIAIPVFDEFLIAKEPEFGLKHLDELAECKGYPT